MISNYKVVLPLTTMNKMQLDLPYLKDKDVYISYFFKACVTRCLTLLDGSFAA